MSGQRPHHRVVAASPRAEPAVVRRPARDAGRLARRYQAILEMAPDATVVADAQGRIRLVNRLTELLFGYPRDDLLGQPVERLIPERFRTVHQQDRADFAAAPRTRPIGADLPLTGRRQDGSEFPVEVSLAPLEEGEAFVIASIRDVSAVQRAQVARQAAEAASAELGQLQALTDTALSHLALDDLLHELLVRIRSVLQVEDIGIFLLDADGQQLKLRAVRGLEDVVAVGAAIPLGQGVAGRVAATRAPLVVDDLSAFPVVYPRLRETEQSAACVPLVVEGHLSGVLYVGSAIPRRFTEGDVQLLQRVADRIALAIDRASAYEAAQAARAEAERHAEQLDRIFEQMTDALVVYDAQGQVARYNAAQHRLLGYDAAPPNYFQLSARERWALLAPRDMQGRPLPLELNPAVRLLRGEMLTGEDTSLDMRIRSFDGREVDINASAAPLRDSEGRIVGAVSIYRDQTERRRLERDREEARVRAEATHEVNERMKQFLATAGHDLRNPVTVALGYVQLTQRHARQLATSAADAAPTHAALVSELEHADHALHRLDRLIGRLFDLAQLQTGRFELLRVPLDLAALVQDAVAFQLAASPERAIQLQLPPDRPIVVLGDADRVDQVLMNYLTNAVKYAPPGRPIVVRLEVDADGWARVAVQDRGPGVPLEQQAHVWELFHRVPRAAGRRGSLGLGLYLCKTLVERHGGQVGLDSVPGRRTTFWFRLPLAGSAPPPSP